VILIELSVRESVFYGQLDIEWVGTASSKRSSRSQYLLMMPPKDIRQCQITPVLKFNNSASLHAYRVHCNTDSDESSGSKHVANIIYSLTSVSRAVLGGATQAWSGDPIWP
jgi:hypothetical protein